MDQKSDSRLFKSDIFTFFKPYFDRTEIRTQRLNEYNNLYQYTRTKKYQKLVSNATTDLFMIKHIIFGGVIYLFNVSSKL